MKSSHPRINLSLYIHLLTWSMDPDSFYHQLKSLVRPLISFPGWRVFGKSQS